jgi:hypothetical protein
MFNSIKVPDWIFSALSSVPEIEKIIESSLSVLDPKAKDTVSVQF